MKHYFAAIMCVILATSCTEKTEKTSEEKSESVFRVKVETVGTQTSMLEGNYVGQVEEQQSTSLSFTGSGTIKQLLVDEGQYVKKGQLIAVIDDTQARNALAAAEATVAQAYDGYKRLKQVYDAGSLAEQKWVEMETNYQQSVATRDMARKSLQDCRLVSPVSGVVGSVSLRAGETALPSMPVINVLNIETVKVKVAIPEREISAITASTPSIITVAALGDKTYQGGRIEKGVSADAITRTYDVKIHVQNPGHKLLPGMVTSVNLATNKVQQTDHALMVPITSVHAAASGKQFVWKMKDGKATRAYVTTGEAVGNRIAILSGINIGDKIVVKGSQKLSEGSSVRE